MRSKKQATNNNSAETSPSPSPPEATQRTEELTALQHTLLPIVAFLRANKIITVACDKGGTSAKSFFLTNYLRFSAPFWGWMSSPWGQSLTVICQILPLRRIGEGH